MTSLMSLMQTAMWPWANTGGVAPTPSPSPTPGGGIGFTPDEINQIKTEIQAGQKKKGIPTESTRARNATALGDPSVNNPLVYMGSTPRHTTFSGTPAATGEGHGSTFVSGGGDHQLTLEQASNQVYTWSPEKVQEMTAKLQAAGFKITSFDDLKQAWGSVVGRAAGMYSVSNGKNKVTPEDVIAMSTAETAAMGSGSGSGGGPSTVTQRTRSVSTITNGDGWSALQNTLSKMLGRDPTDEEVRDFVGRMNHLAAANPTISTSTTTGVGTASQSTTSHTKAGFDSNDILQNAYQQAQGDPNYAEYQSATTYFNSALSALGAIGG